MAEPNHAADEFDRRTADLDLGDETHDTSPQLSLVGDTAPPETISTLTDNHSGGHFTEFT